MSALWLLCGLAIGGAAVWWLQRAEITYLRREYQIATDRLLHAWRADNAVIPPRPQEVRAVPKLPSELQLAVDEWEDPESRVVMEQKVRHLHFERGLTVLGVLRELENDHPA